MTITLTVINNVVKNLHTYIDPQMSCLYCFNFTCMFIRYAHFCVHHLQVITMGNDQSYDDPNDRRVRFADDDDYYDDRRRRYPNDDPYYDDRDRRRYPDDDYNRPRNRRSPSLDSYDRNPRPRENTGASLGQQIRDRARQNNEPPRTKSPPRLPSPPRRQRSPPPSPPTPPRRRTPTPPRRRTPSPPSRTPTPPRRQTSPRPGTVLSPRRPQVEPYVPTIVETPHQVSPRYRRNTPPMTPIHERSPHNGYNNNSRTPTPEHPRPKSRWAPTPREHEEPEITHHVQAAPPPVRRPRRRVVHAEKPEMSPDLWRGDPEPEPQPQEEIIHEQPYDAHLDRNSRYYNPHYKPHPRWARLRQQVLNPQPQVIVQQSQQPQQYRRPKKSKKPQVPQLTLNEKRRFQPNVMGSFYGGHPHQPPRRVQSLRDDDSVHTDPGSVASEGSPWRRRVNKAHAAAVVDPETNEVNAYHLLGHGTGPTHEYFSQNVAVTVIKSPRRQNQNTRQPRPQQQHQHNQHQQQQNDRLDEEMDSDQE